MRRPPPTPAMNPATAHVLQFFAHTHVGEPLQEIFRSFAELAGNIAATSDNPETTVALRKLLEAREAVVRAASACT